MRNSLRDHGYLFVDHGNSPGVPEWMAKMAGYDPAQVREGKRMDVKTLCCAHCKTHVVPNPDRPNYDRATCPKCNHHYICDFCAFRMMQPDYIHDPYDKKVEDALSGRASPPQPLGSPTKLILP
jgi:hypothetical protein